MNRQTYLWGIGGIGERHGSLVEVEEHLPEPGYPG